MKYPWLIALDPAYDPLEPEMHYIVVLFPSERIVRRSNSLLECFLFIQSREFKALLAAA